MAATTNTWKAKMEERRQQEESKKRAAIVAVNDISFPALSGAGGGGWGAAPEVAPPLARSKTTGIVTSYSQTLKAAAAAAEAPISVATSTRDQMAELSVFRHRPAPQFGTSRSSRDDTYYDQDAESVEPTYDGWSTVDKKKPATKSRIDYSSNLTDDDYAGDDDLNHGASNTPNTNW
jgi:hypothetical protein